LAAKLCHQFFYEKKIAAEMWKVIVDGSIMEGVTGDVNQTVTTSALRTLPTPDL